MLNSTSSILGITLRACFLVGALLPSAKATAAGFIDLAPMSTQRYSHTATLLPNGKVLVVGGFGGPGSTILSSAEVYDPASNSWSGAGSMTDARRLHTATLLPNGKV